MILTFGGVKRSGGYGIALQVNLRNIMEDKEYLVIEDIHEQVQSSYGNALESDSHAWWHGPFFLIFLLHKYTQ